MPPQIKKIPQSAGAIVMPHGFKAGAAYCGLKTAPNSLDIGVIFSELPAVAAAVFTNNHIAAAPVKYSRQVIKGGKVRAIVINSGNANACTGRQGYRDAVTMARIAASRLKCTADEILVASTGIIGRRLQMDMVRPGISLAIQDLGNSASHGMGVAKAIMTTDTFPKEVAVEVKGKDSWFTIGGIAKGAGMISPDMATMLCFITTDAAISQPHLDACLRRSIDKSFNKITIDGHTSTNDMVAILANGAAPNNKRFSKKKYIQLFQEALDLVTIQLAKAIVRDGEGATKFVQIEVVGARSEIDAETIARAIADSPLVKTAINGEDPNWGRIISAAGYAGVYIDEKLLRLFVNGILIFKNGTPVKQLSLGKVSFHQRLQKEMQKREITINLELGLGSEKATMWTCDLSHQYVTINAEYHT